MLIVERWILARLRDRRFFSLAGLNAAIGDLLQDLNARPFKKLPGNRQALFAATDQPALSPLPVVPYEFAHWKLARVNIDCHIEVDGHYYSVPYRHLRQQMDVRLTGSVVEVFAKGRRVASHGRSFAKGRHTTVAEHLPPQHQRYLDWSPERLANWAGKIGPQTQALIEQLLTSRQYPQQAYRACLGILRLGKAYGETRLEAACQRALAVHATSYRSIESMLKTGMDRKPLPAAPAQASLPHHENVRGPDYYLH